MKGWGGLGAGCDAVRRQVVPGRRERRVDKPHRIGGMLRWLLSVTSTTPERPTVVLTGRMTDAMVRLGGGGAEEEEQEEGEVVAACVPAIRPGASGA